MEDYTPTTLKIVTTLNRAIDVFPLTQFSNGSARNLFMVDFVVEFRIPEPHKATFISKNYVPKTIWFSLFEDAEKEIMEDEVAFYGVFYSTTIKLALKRLEKLIEKLVNIHNFSKWTEEDIKRFHNHLDNLKQEQAGLKKFREEDEIAMTFLFPEWPNASMAKKTEYVKALEAKIIGLKQEESTLSPF